jgi:imidazole glycerol-phosphate synthase subunit HisH
MNIKLIDYKTGNISSVSSALAKLGLQSEVIESCEDVLPRDVLIFPGVGSFDVASTALRDGGFFNYDFLSNDNTVIGICLGLHLMCKGSQEGNLNGLGLFNERAIDFKGLRSPYVHLGWSKVESKIDELSGRHYFCHRYFVENSKLSKSSLIQEGLNISNVINHGKFWGIQSHPERSGKSGQKLLSWILRQ